MGHVGDAVLLRSTKTDPGPGVLNVLPENSPTWRQACSEALTILAGDDRVDAARLGVLGFSLGGHLALSLAMDPPPGVTLKAVVDFFGPTGTLQPHWAKMPPLLIFHGTDDPLVRPSESDFLVGELEKAGKRNGRDYFYEPTAGETHGFKGAALTKSRDETVEFFKARL